MPLFAYASDRQTGTLLTGECISRIKRSVMLPEYVSAYPAKPWPARERLSNMAAVSFRSQPAGGIGCGSNLLPFIDKVTLNRTCQ
jgi:hypothetical protein